MLTAIAAVVAGFLVVKAADDLRQFTVVTLSGITLAALYFVVASGFILIFGLMRVVNMAHGSLYLLGDYLALRMYRVLHGVPALLIASLLRLRHRGSAWRHASEMLSTS